MPADNAARRLDAADIDRAQAISLADVARERGFVLDRAGNHAGPCPNCGGTDRFSISVRKGAFLCRQCQPKGGGGAIRLVMFLDNVGFREAVERLIGRREYPGAPGARLVNSEPGPVRNPAADAGTRKESAARIWRASVDPVGTLAEKYLKSRGIGLLDDLCGRVLRFNPSCPWKDSAVPALIAAFHPIAESDDDALPVAIMRIGLNADGTKIAKGMMLGPVAGCAVKLDADENVSHGLGIAEGLETALKVRARGWRPVWALGSAGAIERFAPLAGVEALTIFADNDESGRGIAAARTCGQRWADAGLEAFIRIPHRTGADWADIV